MILFILNYHHSKMSKGDNHFVLLSSKLQLGWVGFFSLTLSAHDKRAKSAAVFTFTQQSIESFSSNHHFQTPTTKLNP